MKLELAPTHRSFTLFKVVSSVLHRIKLCFTSASTRQCLIGVLKFNYLRLRYGIKIAFLDQFLTHYRFSEPVLLRVAQQERVLLVVTSKNHPALKNPQLHKNIYPVLMGDINSTFLRLLKIEWLVTPASHLPPGGRSKNTKVVHLYHSPISMHVVYEEHSFDGFSHFFACGPHHVREIESMAKLRGWKHPAVYEVGYPIIDELAEQYQTLVRPADKKSEFKTVLLAPSWHKDNLLKLHGVEIVKTLIAMGLKVFIRPHPHAFNLDRETMTRLEELTREYQDQCFIENPSFDPESFWQADLMISDWSGVAYEFAFATERPVMFINSPQKIKSAQWQMYDLVPMEHSCRQRVGVVVNDCNEISTGIREIMQMSPEEWAQKIKNVRAEYLFNFSHSADVSARTLLNLANQPEL